MYMILDDAVHMKTVTMTELRRNLFHLVDEAVATGEAIVVERKGARIVIRGEPKRPRRPRSGRSAGADSGPSPPGPAPATSPSRNSTAGAPPLGRGPRRPSRIDDPPGYPCGDLDLRSSRRKPVGGRAPATAA